MSFVSGTVSHRGIPSAERVISGLYSQALTSLSYTTHFHYAHASYSRMRKATKAQTHAPGWGVAARVLSLAPTNQQLKPRRWIYQPGLLVAGDSEWPVYEGNAYLKRPLLQGSQFPDVGAKDNVDIRPNGRPTDIKQALWGFKILFIAAANSRARKKSMVSRESCLSFSRSTCWPDPSPLADH